VLSGGVISACVTLSTGVMAALLYDITMPKSVVRSEALTEKTILYIWSPLSDSTLSWCQRTSGGLEVSPLSAKAETMVITRNSDITMGMVLRRFAKLPFLLLLLEVVIFSSPFIRYKFR